MYGMKCQKRLCGSSGHFNKYIDLVVFNHIDKLNQLTL